MPKALLNETRDSVLEYNYSKARLIKSLRAQGKSVRSTMTDEIADSRYNLVDQTMAARPEHNGLFEEVTQGATGTIQPDGSVLVGWIVEDRPLAEAKEAIIAHIEAKYEQLAWQPIPCDGQAVRLRNEADWSWLTTKYIRAEKYASPAAETVELILVDGSVHEVAADVFLTTFTAAFDAANARKNVAQNLMKDVEAAADMTALKAIDLSEFA
jgi:hypothetical protein